MNGKIKEISDHLGAKLRYLTRSRLLVLRQTNFLSIRTKQIRAFETNLMELCRLALHCKLTLKKIAGLRKIRDTRMRTHENVGRMQ